MSGFIAFITMTINKFSHLIVGTFLYYDGTMPMYWSRIAVLKKKHLLGKFDPKYRPFCSKCFETKDKLVHLMKGSGSSKVEYECPECGWQYRWSTDKNSRW